MAALGGGGGRHTQSCCMKRVRKRRGACSTHRQAASFGSGLFERPCMVVVVQLAAVIVQTRWRGDCSNKPAPLAGPRHSQLCVPTLAAPEEDRRPTVTAVGGAVVWGRTMVHTPVINSKGAVFPAPKPENNLTEREMALLLSLTRPHQCSAAVSSLRLLSTGTALQGMCAWVGSLDHSDGFEDAPRKPPKPRPAAATPSPAPPQPSGSDAGSATGPPAGGVSRKSQGVGGPVTKSMPPGLSGQQQRGMSTTKHGGSSGGSGAGLGGQRGMSSKTGGNGKDQLHDPQLFPFAAIPCNTLPAKPR